jgi:hypothetical protein
MQCLVLFMPTILDLCSGLGGASEAFAQAGWTVIRIENNEELDYIPFTQILNVLEWEQWLPQLGERIDVVWASPPCREFSQAFAAPGPSAQREGIEYRPNMAIFAACLDIIDYLKPKHWVIENVVGSSRWFHEYVGPGTLGWIFAHPQKVGPFLLYGNHPRIIMPNGFNHLKSEHDTWSTDPMRANLKAMIPFEVSFAFLEAVTRQWTLDRWCEFGN